MILGDDKFMSMTGNALERVSGQIWLNFFNDYLLENKVISEAEYSAMRRKIIERYGEKDGGKKNEKSWSDTDKR